MFLIMEKNHPNRSYPQVFLATLKFAKNRKKLYRTKIVLGRTVKLLFKSVPQIVENISKNTFTR